MSRSQSSFSYQRFEVTQEDFFEAISQEKLRKGDYFVFQKFINKTTLNRTHHGYTPLMIASERGHTDFVESLLSYANVDIKPNVNGQTAIDLALLKGHTIILEKFFLWACLNGDIEIVKKLKALPNFNIHVCDQHGLSGIYRAYCNGHTNVTNELIDRNLIGGDITPPQFLDAVEKGDTETVHNFIQQNANINEAITYPIYIDAFLLAQSYTPILSYSEKWETIMQLLYFPLLTKCLLDAGMNPWQSPPLMKKLLKFTQPGISLCHLKQDLANVLFQLPIPTQLTAYDYIFTDKVETAFRRLFAYHKTNFNKGVWLKIKNHHLALLTNELEIKLTEVGTTHQTSTSHFEQITSLFQKGTTLPKSTNKKEIFAGLLQWLLNVSPDVINDSLLENLKLFKEQLSESIDNLPNPRFAYEKIFDETKPDKKNLTTSLGKIFCNSNADYRYKRLGEAFRKYKALPPTIPSMDPTFFYSRNADMPNKEKPTELVELIPPLRKSRDNSAIH